MKAVKCARDVRLRDVLVSGVPGRFPGALAEGPGLSFSHSGLSHEEVMIRLRIVEDVRDDSEASRTRRRVRLEDPDNGLQVGLEYTLYPAHNAVVYGATLHNAGNRNIDHVRELRSYDLTLAPLDKIGAPRVHTMGGGVTHYSYPPLAYRMAESHLLGPTRMSIDSGPSGRSSNEDFPFFYVEDGDRTSGVFGGIEWSGLWHIGFTRRDDPYQVHYGHLGPEKSLSIEGGMDEVDLLLKTGETFHMPRVLLGFYEGSIETGRNAMRRFIGEWVPNLADGTPMPITQGTPGGYICPTEMTNDEQCRANEAANAEIGVECYIIENWFESLSDHPESWGATGAARGSWVPDPDRFPDLKAHADYARSTGMKFGLWTDMEVAHAESRVARAHPEWVLYLDGNPSGLFNLGERGAQDWAIATYDRLIGEYGLEWIFYDNNINPRPFWDVHEVSQRKGWMQHDYIRGVWRVWDETRKRHPNVVFENCSSGGRRIDLGTLARAHCNVISDQFRHPDSIRYQFSGANTVVPGDRLKSILCAGFEDYPDYGFQSNFGGLLSISEGVEYWTPEQKERAKQHYDVYKSVRQYLSKDYYEIFPQPRSLEDWDGWQFHDPETDEGFVLVFRVESPQESASPPLRGLNPSGQYVLTDAYSGEEMQVSGSALTDNGLSVTLPLRGTRLLRYRQT